MSTYQHHTVDLDAIARQAMIDRDLLPDFSKDVQLEVGTLKEPAIPLPQVSAKDLRNLLWFSIDNDDSRDLDQLTHAESMPEGKTRLRVAVADVSYLVKQQSAIDQHAVHNTTSVYTPSKIFPMLPEKLSTDLTSLNPGEDRLALIMEGTISQEGALEDSSVYLAYVHNYAKLAYNGVSAWLDGKALAPEAVTATQGMDAQIRLQDVLAQKLATHRHEAGALSLETIEAFPIISNGMVVDLKATEITRSRRLIENFMIVANTISVQYSTSRALPVFRRVVTIPKRWDRIMAIAQEHGTTLLKEPNAIALEQFLVKQKQRDPDSYPDLSLTIIKLLGRGEYRVTAPGKQGPGHFGLALRDYSHSTAPNRRYPDLITQRLIISSLLQLPLPYQFDELASLAEHCTQKEDDADKVERRTRKSAAALVLSPMIGKEFKAIVTGAGEQGTWVRLFEPPVEGKLVKGAQGVDVGDRITVKLINTDVWNGYIDFAKA